MRHDGMGKQATIPVVMSVFLEDDGDMHAVHREFKENLKTICFLGVPRIYSRANMRSHTNT